MMIDVDYHSSFQQIAFFDQATGEWISFSRYINFFQVESRVITDHTAGTGNSSSLHSSIPNTHCI